MKALIKALLLGVALFSYAVGACSVKVYNGSTWVEKPVKVYNGSTWVEKPLKYYTGSAWESCVAATPAIASTLLLTDEYLGSTSANPGINETTTSFTTSDDTLLVAMIGASNQTNALTGNLTVSGGSLTWTRRVTIGADYISTYYNTTEIWTAPVTTGASITLDIDSSVAAGSAFGAHLQYTIWEVENYDSTGATATGTFDASGSHSITLSASPATTSLVFAARSMIATVGNGTSATPGGGWTELMDVNHTNTGLLSLQAQERDGSTSTTVNWSEISSFTTITAGTSVALEVTQ